MSEFISIDCGIAEGSDYVDTITGLLYKSDAGFVNSGESRTVVPSITSTFFLEPKFLNLRSFPQGTRNCYTLRPSSAKNNKYLIRLRFFYGNYDRQNKLPEFDVHLGIEYWDTVSLEEEDDLMLEMIHVSTSDYIRVCFINTGWGTPFVSVLELRPLPSSTYPFVFGSLKYLHRWNLGSYDTVRYDDDIYDRMWVPGFAEVETKDLLTTSTHSSDTDDLPWEVMRTAIAPRNASEGLLFTWFPKNTTTNRYIFYTHFAEVEVLRPNQTRSFNIYLNGDLWDGPISPEKSTITISNIEPVSCGTVCEMTINRTKDSTLPPIINAFEVYHLMTYEQPETDENDVESIMGIRSAYNLTKNWQGDPCSPPEHAWDGVNCSFGNFTSPRIISLNLSSSRLTGRLALPIKDLKTLQALDLSNNRLIGQVPDFLFQMTSLRILRLHGNNFTGSIPAELIERSKDGSLTLSIDGLVNNPSPCDSTQCGGRRNNSRKLPIVVILASLLAGSLGLLVAGGLVFWWMAD